MESSYSTFTVSADELTYTSYFSQTERAGTPGVYSENNREKEEQSGLRYKTYLIAWSMSLSEL